MPKSRDYNPWIRTFRESAMQPCAISVIKGDITTLDVDAIINSANRFASFGGGGAGPRHQATRVASPRRVHRALRLLRASRLTKGYALPARHVIHRRASPGSAAHGRGVETLRRAVTSALDIARDMKFETVAFCCISRGIHRFPVDLAAKTTLEAMLAHDFAGRDRLRLHRRGPEACQRFCRNDLETCAGFPSSRY
ncbi:MAG: macro domain-containing protein [Sutterella wadsworthensis]